MQNSVVGGSSILTGKMMVGEDRIMIKPSQTKNRKKKGQEVDLLYDAHLPKRTYLGELNDLVHVLVEAATQPQRSL